MKPVVTDWVPRNEITTPLAGKPTYINSGIIKAVLPDGGKVSVGQIDYQEFDEENFQYIISPFWEMIEGLPPSVFQGIPGIDMDLRLVHYYRANYIPTFIAERTPSENREDLWELLEEVGLDYYDRFEWLLRTPLRCANDNLIVERRKSEKTTCEYSQKIIPQLQYGDCVVLDDLRSISNTERGFSNALFGMVANGVDIVDKNGEYLVDAANRETLLPILFAQRMLAYRERIAKQKEGIEKAKSEGKYQGRKPIDVDMQTLEQVAKELDQKIISVAEAMKRVGTTSRSTFYRKLKQVKKEK